MQWWRQNVCHLALSLLFVSPLICQEWSWWWLPSCSGTLLPWWGFPLPFFPPATPSRNVAKWNKIFIRPLSRAQKEAGKFEPETIIPVIAVVYSPSCHALLPLGDRRADPPERNHDGGDYSVSFQRIRAFITGTGLFREMDQNSGPEGVSSYEEWFVPIWFYFVVKRKVYLCFIFWEMIPTLCFVEPFSV